jgi:hypothetical protein
MARPLKTPRTISRKDQEFEDLLRRAFEYLNRSQPPKALTKTKNKRSKVA